MHFASKQPMIGLFERKITLAVACLMNPTPLGPNRFWHWRIKNVVNRSFLAPSRCEKNRVVRAHMRPVFSYVVHL